MPPRKKQIPKAVKREVWNKHIGEEIGKSKCQCCEKADISQLNFHCGHIQSEAEGGEIHVNNLLPICEVCNSSMGTKNLYEFKKMLVEPKSTVNVIEPKPTDNIKIKLKELLEKTKQCSHMYYIGYGTNHEVREILLKRFDGDDTPYKIIEDTYRYFYNSKGNISNTDRYYHIKCNEIFLIETHALANEYSTKIKNFVKHIDCLLNDDDFINFVKAKKYLNKD